MWLWRVLYRIANLVQIDNFLSVEEARLLLENHTYTKTRESYTLGQESPCELPPHIHNKLQYVLGTSLSVQSSWYSASPVGGIIVPHNHTDTDLLEKLSVVIYLSGSGKELLLFPSTGVSYPTTPLSLAVFPSSYTHSVCATQDTDRVCLAADLLPRKNLS